MIVDAANKGTVESQLLNTSQAKEERFLFCERIALIREKSIFPTSSTSASV